MASASGSGMTSNSDNPARSKNPPTPSRVGTQQPDPAPAEPSTDEADDGTAGAIQPVQVVDDDE